MELEYVITNKFMPRHIIWRQKTRQIVVVTNHFTDKSLLVLLICFYVKLKYLRLYTILLRLHLLFTVPKKGTQFWKTNALIVSTIPLTRVTEMRKYDKEQRIENRNSSHHSCVHEMYKSDTLDKSKIQNYYFTFKPHDLF